MTGLYYEQFEIGMEFKHSLTRTVTESDNLLFCALTHNPQPLHLDEEFSKETEYGQRIVNSLFTHLDWSSVCLLVIPRLGQLLVIWE